jgi:hypothetical protein
MLSVVVKIDKVRTPAVTFKLDKETRVLFPTHCLSIVTLYFYIKIETFMYMEVTERIQQPPFICI